MGTLIEALQGTAMIEKGPRYHRAAEATARIVNLLCADWPGRKAVLFGRVLFMILDAMNAADRELHAQQSEPSNN